MSSPDFVVVVREQLERLKEEGRLTIQTMPSHDYCLKEMGEELLDIHKKLEEALKEVLEL